MSIGITTRTENIVRQALIEGLRAKELVETNMYTWQGNIKPSVIAQLTTKRILATKGSGPKILVEIERYLKSFKLTLKDKQPAESTVQGNSVEGEKTAGCTS